MSFNLDVAEQPVDIDAGEWVSEIPGHPGMKMKVRSAAYKKFEVAHGRLLRGLGRNASKAMDSADYKQSVGKMIADHLLLGWENAITKGGEDVKYSKDIALQVLTMTDDRGVGDAFRDAVVWSAGVVKDRHLGIIEDLEGN